MYTGNGPDHQYAGMMQSNGQPFMVHRGEMVQQTPEGAMVLNKKTTGMAYPSFASGGFNMTNPYNPGTKDAYEWNKANPQTETPQQGNPYNAGTKEAYEWSRANPQIPAAAQTQPTGNPYNPGTKDAYEWNKANSIAKTITTDVIDTASQKPSDTTIPAYNPPGTPQISSETQARNTGLDYLQNTITGGKSPSEIAAKQALDQMTARQQQERSAASQRAEQTGVDSTQARVESQMLRNQQESELNTTAAGYQANIADEKIGIANTLASQGLAGQQFEEAKKQYGNSAQWTAYENAVAAGDFTTAANMYKQITGQTLSTAQLETYQNYLNTKQQQEVASGNLSITSQQISNEAARLGVDSGKFQAFVTAVNSGSDLAAANAASGLSLTAEQYGGIRETYAKNQASADVQLASLRNSLGDAQWNSVQDMINSGADLTQVNERLAEQGKAGVTSSQFTSMVEATPLGERNWGRKMTAANMMLQSGDGNQIIKAEAALKELFPGFDFNFDSIIQENRASAISTGLSRLASYVTANMTAQQAVDTLKASGIAGKMGINDEGIIDLYNSLNVNAVDAEWDELESSDFYKGLSEEEKFNQLEFFRQKMLGQLDYTTLHEYEITNPNDANYKLTVYAKDNTEADKKAASLGAGYVVKDTGNVKFQMASTITGSGSSTGTTKGDFEAFNSTQPEGKEITIDQWEKANKPATWDEYSASAGPLKNLESLNIESPSDLLSTANSTKLFDAWKEDPEAIRKSQYYAKGIPTDKILRDEAIPYKDPVSGARSLKFSETVLENLKNSVGAIVEFPDKNGTVSGQLIDVVSGPTSLVAKLKQPDGSIINYPMVTVGFNDLAGTGGKYKIYGTEGNW
jgi:hypothetical protein